LSDPKRDLEGEADMVDDMQVWEMMRRCGKWRRNKNGDILEL
jgi:hypothetical protein